MSRLHRFTLAIVLIFSMLGTLVANAHFSQTRHENVLLSTGQSVWFYLQLIPGEAVVPDNQRIATGHNQSLTLNYGNISSTLGLLNLPLLGLLYQPEVYLDTFRIVNKSTTTLAITVTVSHTSGPGAMTLKELLYMIPASAYSGTASRAHSYTFSLLPGNTQSLHSVIVTGSLVTNIIGLLLFSPFPTGAYNGHIRLDIQHEGQATTLLVPAALNVY